MFKFFSGADAELDAAEYMQIIKGSGLVDSNLSFARMLDIFTRTNVEEVNEFLGAAPEYEGLEDMKFELDEFVDSMVACAYTKLKPGKPFTKCLEKFLLDLLENCSKKRF